ncbi:hypothetical protein Vafri_18970 [Volvox africanus]|uniref:Peptidase M11 gametolysin domain-containing protein n=1 Tax=Volvox africanus TaxID=51714 RepID=A0A8J4F971_9CHLO|nr:hypothetical protein Vafri_18970 [Volvox africanus]
MSSRSFMRSILLVVCVAFLESAYAQPKQAENVNNGSRVTQATVMFRVRAAYNHPPPPKRQPWLPPPLKAHVRPFPPSPLPTQRPLPKVFSSPRPPFPPPPSPRRSPPPRPPSPRPSPPPPRPPRRPHLPPAPKLLPDPVELQIVCPLSVNTGFTRRDPNCNTPIGKLASGKAAEALIKKYGIMSGDKATALIQSSPEPASSRRLLAGQPPALTYSMVEDPLFVTHGGQKEIYQGTTIDLITIVFRLDFGNCSMNSGWRRLPAPAMMNAIYRNSSLPNNLQNYYSTCLRGKARLGDENTFVVKTAINITCSGVLVREGLPDTPWDSSTKCGVAEQQAWELQAEEQAMEIAATDPALSWALRQYPRRRHIYILPPSVPCPWAGYADVTCTSFVCSSFLRVGAYNTLSSTDLHVIMHEAMHNFGLEHAGTESDPYGDPTDVMGDFSSRNGSRDGLLCPCAAHLYRIGIAMPVRGNWDEDIRGAYGNLTASNFTKTGQVTIVIPAASSREDHMVVVNLGRINSTYSFISSFRTDIPIFYLSFRVASPDIAGYDSGLRPEHNRSVLVHTYNGIQDEVLSNGVRPQFITYIPKDGTWSSDFYDFYSDTGGKLRVKVKSLNDTQAEVVICRAHAAREIDCVNDLDDDCNGYTDRCDPACTNSNRIPRGCPKSIW